MTKTKYVPKKFSHIGEVLKIILKISGLSQNDFSRKTGWSISCLSRVCRGTGTISQEMLNYHKILEKLPELCGKGWALYEKDFMYFFNSLPKEMTERSRGILMKTRNVVARQNTKKSFLKSWQKSVAETVQRSIKHHDTSIAVLASSARTVILQGDKGAQCWKKIIQHDPTIVTSVYLSALHEITRQLSPKQEEKANIDALIIEGRNLVTDKASRLVKTPGLS